MGRLLARRGRIGRRLARRHLHEGEPVLPTWEGTVARGHQPADAALRLQLRRQARLAPNADAPDGGSGTGSTCPGPMGMTRGTISDMRARARPACRGCPTRRPSPHIPPATGSKPPGNAHAVPRRGQAPVRVHPHTCRPYGPPLTDRPWPPSSLVPTRPMPLELLTNLNEPSTGNTHGKWVLPPARPMA